MATDFTILDADAPGTSCCASSCCKEDDPDPSGSESDVAVDPDSGDVHRVVRDHYGRIAATGATGCGCSHNGDDLERFTALLGYSMEELQAVPEGANLGLGCGNPTAIDAIPSGATVLDLGSGGGFDCFLAARKVGPTGHVIGVDMTPEMIDRARVNARKAGLMNVEFRLGEIEALPLADASADVIISNCVINLSPDKSRVFAEAFRVLKPGGRLMVSDLVLTSELPAAIRQSAAAYAACISGAELKEHYLELIRSAGFTKVVMAGERRYAGVPVDGVLGGLQESGTLPIASIEVSATKPQPD